jgi:uncharacterized protein
MKNRLIFLALFWLVSLLGVMPVSAEVTYPQPENPYINDFAKVLSSADDAAMRRSLEDLQKQTGIQMVVVTVNAVAGYGGEALPFPTYAAQLFDRWGIGDKTANTGILIFFSLKDRETWIEMGLGYKHRFDREIQQIVDVNMIPQFKTGNYSSGIYDGTYAVMNAVTKKMSWFAYYKWHLLAAMLAVACILAGISCMRSGKKGWGWAFFAVAGAILFFLWKSLSRGRSGGGGGFGGGRSGGGGGGGRW